MKIIRDNFHASSFNVIYHSDNEVLHVISYPHTEFYSQEDFTDEDLLEYLAGDVYLYTSIGSPDLEDQFITWGRDPKESENHARQIRLSYGFYLDCTQRERDHMNFLVSDLDNSDGVEL